MTDIVSGMRIFVRVVETGSFTAVAKENNATAGQISRAVTALEQQLHTVLLHRTTRHLAVSESGGRFYERAKAILADIESATDEARDSGVSLAGKVRVHCSPGLAQGAVGTALASYQSAYPDVFVELKIEQGMPNLVRDGYDLSIISATQLPDSSCVARPLGSAYSVMVASPDYLNRHGMPRTRDDLRSHALLMLESTVSPPDEWHLESEEGAQIWKIPQSSLQMNVPDVLRATLLAGAGIGALATYTVVDDLVEGKLVRVLPHYRLKPFTVFAVYPSHRYLDTKVRTLFEHLRSTLSSSLKSAIECVEELARRDTAQT